MKKIKHIGILGAMPEEVQNSLENLKNIYENNFGDLKIYSGEWTGNKEEDDFVIFLSIAWSGWGKVSAARATTRLLSLNLENVPKIETIIFNGVAGSAELGINQWDIVIPDELVQYDMDASPIFETFVIPSLKVSELKTNIEIINWAKNNIRNFLSRNPNMPFGKIYGGLVGTGDNFISEEYFLDKIKKKLPSLVAIEMEGASFAQVAIQEKINWLVIRVISDNAKSSAPESFKEFIENYKSFSWPIISHLLSEWATFPFA